MKNIKNISSGTWVRLALLAGALINISLSLLGKNPVMGDGTAADVVSIIAACSTALVSYWKNNSFTSAAIRADRFLEKLKENEKF